MGMNPWDSFESAPYAFLYRDGTEMALSEVPPGAKFITMSDGARYIEKGRQEEKGYLVTRLGGTDSWLPADEPVVVDDRVV